MANPPEPRPIADSVKALDIARAKTPPIDPDRTVEPATIRRHRAVQPDARAIAAQLGRFDRVVAELRTLSECCALAGTPDRGCCDALVAELLVVLDQMHQRRTPKML